MSNQDSFIDEVSEEVRRDRLYRLFRKYGWIGALAVVLIVGGAAFNEWRKASIEAEAQAAGDALLSAFETTEAEGRAEALASLDPGENPGRNAIVTLSQAAAMAEAGDIEGSVTLLETLATDPGAPQVYRDVASLKAVLIGADSIEPDERISRMNDLVQGGGAFSLLALEQIALAEVDAGRTDAAISTLREILADASVTQDLRRRATQLMVSLGASQASLEQ